MRTVVTFESDAFNTSESKEYFINPSSFGDDVAQWLMARLRSASVEVDEEPGQEDFGWYFNFTLPEGRHCCVLGYRPAGEGEPGLWIAWLERSRGLLGSLIGGRKRGISPAAVALVHQALSGAPEITRVTWHERADFDGGREELGAEQP
jgi:hypothetical protein